MGPLCAHHSPQLPAITPTQTPPQPFHNLPEPFRVFLYAPHLQVLAFSAPFKTAQKIIEIAIFALIAPFSKTCNIPAMFMRPVLILALLFTLNHLCAAPRSGDYVVVVSRQTLNDPAWESVVSALLVKNHGLPVIYEKELADIRERTRPVPTPAMPVLSPNPRNATVILSPPSTASPVNSMPIPTPTSSGES